MASTKDQILDSFRTGLFLDERRGKTQAKRAPSTTSGPWIGQFLEFSTPTYFEITTGDGVGCSVFECAKILPIQDLRVPVP